MVMSNNDCFVLILVSTFTGQYLFSSPFAVPRFRHFMILKKTLGSLERNLWLKYMDSTENPDII